jgi:7-cyano-7-deazaguanine synthase
VVRGEIERRFPLWAARLGEDHLLELATLGQISDTALTREAQFEMTAAGLPNTFVPGRNLLFFTYAAALAYRRGIRTLVGGMCETDFSGYPDCRNDTLQSLARSISLGMDAAFAIETPLMWVDKAGTWEMAEKLGGAGLVELIVEHTHTCYTPNRTARHAWGYGCGKCPACALRAKGWETWQNDTS